MRSNSMDHGFLIPASLFLLCLAIRCGYELLKEARKIDPESKPIFATIFTTMCVLWVSWFKLCLSDPFPVDMPGPVRWTALALMVIGTVLAVGAFIQLRGVENIQQLVTTGLFKKFRHPMYVGFVLWILGWSIYHGAVVSLAIGLVGIVSVLWWRHLEQDRLEVQFGDSYRQYRLRTWF
jgi:protein-S-isoprenylcysteine O-methyltransferase Ste14